MMLELSPEEIYKL